MKEFGYVPLVLGMGPFLLLRSSPQPKVEMQWGQAFSEDCHSHPVNTHLQKLYLNFFLERENLFTAATRFETHSPYFRFRDSCLHTLSGCSDSLGRYLYPVLLLLRV